MPDFGSSDSFSERLDDVFARRGFATYRRIRRFLTRHTVTVNGVRALSGGFRINLFSDKIEVDSKPFIIPCDIFIMMNKAQGFVCSTVCAQKPGEGSDIPTVYDLLPKNVTQNLLQGNLHTVGRLDADTEGLLLFTTNGDFSHKVCMPDFHIKKTYLIVLKNPLSNEEQKNYVDQCAKGFFIPRKWNSPSFTCKPSDLKFTSNSECLLTICEGKFHQVKRMMCALGNEVVYLKRVFMGKLKLDENLKPRQWRFMTQEEIVSVLK